MIDKKLVFFGDSFTAGDEILDYQCVPNYPSYKNHYELLALQEKEFQYAKRPDLSLYLDSEQLKKHKMRERKNSYAGLLGENKAKSGMSLQSMARNIVDYLENSESQCIIFLQPSGMERWSDFVNGEWVEFIGHDWWKVDPSSKDYFKFRLANSTEQSNMITWFVTFMTLTSYIKTHQKVNNWFLIDCGIFKNIAQLITYNGWSNIYTKGIDSYKDKIIAFPHVDDLENSYFCPGGHVNMDAHMQLVDRIKQKIL
jgi:hypothetical protein